MKFFNLQCTFILVIFLIGTNYLIAQELQNAEADRLVAGANYIVQDIQTGTISLIRQKKYVPGDSGLVWLKDRVLKLRADDDLALISDEADGLNYRHQKYQQYYKNIPVEQGQYILHSIAGHIVSANGKFYNDLKLDVVPQISKEHACAIAISHISSKKLNPEVNSMESGKLQ